MKKSLLYSLLELAHATSQNLGFAHRPDVHVSYGEETITETNLLELRRRHPRIIKLQTFAKKQEAQNGADWEWHIIGKKRTFRMRVQAKRLQKNGVLKISHKVKRSGKEQIDLLIEDASKNRLCPIYCIYSAEFQRELRPEECCNSPYEYFFEYGCLLANAHTVKSMMPKNLRAIEKECVPWHYLVERRRYKGTSISGIFDADGGALRFLLADDGMLSGVDDVRAFESGAADSFPLIDELNAKERPERDIQGLIEADDLQYLHQSSVEEYRERGIDRLLEIDVSNFRPPLDGEAAE